MKFEEILPLLRTGAKGKCRDIPGYYLVVRKSIFDRDLGLSIFRVDPDLKSSDIFGWGVDGYSLLSDGWELYEEDSTSETQAIDCVLDKAIEQTIFNFFMNSTKLFTRENALLPPLSKPLAEKIMLTLKQFFKVDQG